jgi:hypothetical protein
VKGANRSTSPAAKGQANPYWCTALLLAWTRVQFSASVGLRIGEPANALTIVPNESLALRMFPNPFPISMKTAPGEFSEGRFR